MKKRKRGVGKKAFLNSRIWSETGFLALLPFEMVICILTVA